MIILKRLRPVVLNILLSNPVDHLDLIKHAKIKEVINSFKISRPLGPPRAVYIVTRPISDGDGNPSLRDEVRLTSQLARSKVWSRRALVLAGVKHWSILVAGSDESPWIMFEMAKQGRNNMTLRHVRGGEVQTTNEWRLFLVGHTFLDDEQIKHLAEAIPVRKGEDYNLFLNNCQTFCRLLFLCIRIPSTLHMVFEALPAVPHRFADEVITRQLREYEVCRLYGDELDIISTALPERFPVSVEMSLCVLCRVMIVASLGFVLTRFIGKRLALLAIVLATPYARLDIWRFLSQYYASPVGPENLCSILHSGTNQSGLMTALCQARRQTIFGMLRKPPPVFLFSPLYHSLSRSELVVPFEQSCFARQIEDCVIGFDKDDIRMANMITPPDQTELEGFLALNDPAMQQEYQIGLAFVGKTGHAEVVIRHGGLSGVASPANLDLTGDRPVFAARRLVVARGGVLRSADGPGLRLLHIRFSPRDRNPGRNRQTLEFALEPPPSGKISYYRFADLYRFRTTERLLRHVALKSCPPEHRILVDDCATLAYNFLTGLLEHWESRGSISQTEHARQRLLLLWHNHVSDGVFGGLEVGVRVSSSAVEESQASS
jgi:hypothetical protein